MAKTKEVQKSKTGKSNKNSKESKSKDSKGKVSKDSKKSKDDAELTPLEKARIARAANKGKPGKGGKAKKKNALPIFKAPADFKPHFVTVMMGIEKDGLLASAIKVTRYDGRYDPEASDKKKFDVSAYDTKTVQGILSRFAMVTYVTSPLKRLPVGAVYQVLLRINRKAADDSLSVLFKGMEVMEKSKKTGRQRLVALDNKDAVYRRFRKAKNILPSAFKDVLMPPKRTRGANKKEEEDE